MAEKHYLEQTKFVIEVDDDDVYEIEKALEEFKGTSDSIPNYSRCPCLSDHDPQDLSLTEMKFVQITSSCPLFRLGSILLQRAHTAVVAMPLSAVSTQPNILSKTTPSYSWESRVTSETSGGSRTPKVWFSVSYTLQLRSVPCAIFRADHHEAHVTELKSWTTPRERRHGIHTNRYLVRGHAHAIKRHRIPFHMLIDKYPPPTAVPHRHGMFHPCHACPVPSFVRWGALPSLVRSNPWRPTGERSGIVDDAEDCRLACSGVSGCLPTCQGLAKSGTFALTQILPQPTVLDSGPRTSLHHCCRNMQAGLSWRWIPRASGPIRLHVQDSCLNYDRPSMTPSPRCRNLLASTSSRSRATRGT